MNANDHAPAGQSDVLRSAWKRMVELDLQSSKVSKQSMQLRRWIAILGVVATFLAIVTNEVRGEVYPLVEQILRGFLILVPIVISGMAAYANKFFGGANGLVMRAGSEEIKKEVYLYRTVLRNHPDRNRWLSRRMTTIQRRTYKSLGGELIIESYEGKLPMYYNPDDPNSDPGFNDLSGDDYLRYRVIDQRDWHRRKIIQLKEERVRIQRTILVMGGLGALLAAVPTEWAPGWGLASWVALTAAIASAFTGWEQLRGLDKILPIYSRVILELTIIRDEWEAIPRHQRTEADFVAMVRAAEDVMWAQNMQYISTMQEAITSGQGDEAELVENMLKEGDSMTLDLQAKLMEEAKGVLTQASAELGKVVEDSAATVKSMVTNVATTATNLQEKVKETVENEVGAFDDMVGDGLDRVTTETAAVRTTVTKTVDTAMNEVAATRQLVETTTQAAAVETAAFRDTAQTTVDTALAEAAATRAAIQTTTNAVVAQTSAMRDTVQTTVTEQTAATRATVEATAQTVSAEAEAIRDTVQTTVTEQAAATRATVDATAQTVSAEASAIRDTVQTTITEQAAATRATVDATAQTVSAEVGAMRDTVQTTVTEQAVTTREMVESASVSVSEEADTLRQTAQTTLDTALDESSALRNTVTNTTETLAAEVSAARQAVETGSGHATPLANTAGEIRGMVEEKIATDGKKQKKETEAKLSKKLDAMLDEAADVIDTATDTMRDKMAEEVAQKIVEVATEKKPKNAKGSAMDESKPPIS